VINFDDPLLIEIAYDVNVPMRDLSVALHLFDSMNNCVFESMDTDLVEWKGCHREPGRYLATAKIPPSLIKPGRYYVSLASFIEGVKLIEHLERAVMFDVSTVGYTFHPNRWGIIAPLLDWKVCRVNTPS
jgi:hypothetical protein